MDIERFKQITVLMIKSGIKVEQARDEIKEYQYERQDLHLECLSETCHLLMFKKKLKIFDKNLNLVIY